jgi:hypothetical protein
VISRRRTDRAPIVAGALFLVALVAPLAVAADPAGRVPRVAILAAAAQRGLADLLTAELSQQRNLELVERDAIDRVLNELSLSAVQAGDGEQGAKLGDLLAADALLFVEPEPQSQPPQVRLKLVETRTGIRLGDWPVPAAEIGAGDLADVLAGLRQAAAKLGVPPGDRHLVGMIGIRPEVATSDLATLARVVTALVERDLAALPDVVVLDRAQLRRLTTERDLTGLELELKASSQLVAGGIRRAGDRLALTLKLTPTKGGASRAATRTSAADLATLRRATVEALAALVDTEPPPVPARADAAAESAQLAALARRLCDLEAYAEAIRVAEAAYVLAPGRETFEVANHVYLFAQQALSQAAHTLEQQPDFPPPWFTRDLYPTAGDARVARLEMLVGWSELLRDFYEVCAHDPNLEAEFPTRCHVLFGMRTAPKSAVEQQLAADQERIAQATYERILAVRRAAGGPGAAQLILCRLESVGEQPWTRGPGCGEALVRFLREIEAELAREEAAGRLRSARHTGPRRHWLPEDRARFDAWHHDLMLKAIHRVDATPESSPELKLLLESLAAGDVAGLRLVGWSRLLTLPGEPGADAAERFLDTLFSGAVPRAARPFDPIPEFEQQAHKAAQRLATAGRLPALIERLLARAEADQDLSRLLEWPTALRYLIGSDRERSEVFAGRVDALLAKGAYAAKAKPAADFYRHHQAILRAYHTRTGPYAPPKAGRLDGYQIHALEIANPEPDFRHLAGFHVDRTPDGDPQRPLVLVWARHSRFPLWREKDDPPEFDYLIGRVGMDGGPMTVTGRCRLPIKQILCMASAGDRHFFATEQGLVVVTGRGSTRIGEAEGLPGKRIMAMAWLDGRLYAGCENHLVAVDPDKPACDVIASALSVASRNPLDGVGAFTITGLAADSPRKRLVVLVTSNERHDKTPNGLWLFTPADAAWRRLDGTHEQFEGLVWGGGFVYSGKDIRRPPPAGRIVQLDLETLRVATLPPGHAVGVPFCTDCTTGWAFMDDLLFSPLGAKDASGTSHVWSGGAGHLGQAIHRIGDELVVFDRAGSRLWVVRRTPAPGGQDPTP